jgi:hypothetical protein
VIPAIHPRGANVGGLLRYLFGPGRREEHTDAHLIVAWTGAEPLAELGAAHRWRRAPGRAPAHRVVGAARPRRA